MTQDSESVGVPREEEVARLAADAATRGASLKCGDCLGAWEEGDHPYGRAGNCPFCGAEQSYTNLWYNGPGSPPSYAWQCCECGAQGPTSSGRFRGDHYGAILDAKALWDAAAPSTSVREEVDPDLLKRLSDRLAMATPGPWTVQDGCSWRRVGTQFHDGNVLCPTNHPRDNHPDLTAADGKLYANLMLIVEVVNALPTLLAALVPSTDEGKRL